LKLAEPTIPPMMRAPYTNQVPDYLVVDDKLHKFGLGGGVRQAGFWTWNWRVDLASSYVAQGYIL
jgi:hypothetical protein